MQHQAVRIATFALFLALVGCTPPAPEAISEATLQQAESLLADGQAAEALAILQASNTDANLTAKALLVEALVHDGQFDEAHQALAAVTDEQRHRALLIDLCVRGVEAASPDAERMSALLAHCDGIERVDLMAAAALLSVATLPEVPEVTDGYPDRGMLALESPLDAMILYTLTRRITETAPGRARDDAGRLLEQAYLLASTRVPDPVARVLALKDAYLVRRTPALGEGLLQTIVSRADALASTDPQGAATLYEIVIFGNVGDLEVPEDMHARATSQTRSVLFPVFLENFADRYDRKHLENDQEAGIVTGDDRTARFAPADSMDAREQALSAWLYRVAERPAPINPPPFAPQFDGCADSSTACEVPFEGLARAIYNIDQIEQAHADATGIAIAYPINAAPE